MTPPPPRRLEVGPALWCNSCQGSSSDETTALLLPFPVLACFPYALSPEIPSSGTATHSHPCLRLCCEGTWPSQVGALCCTQLISAPAKGASMFNTTPKSPWGSTSCQPTGKERSERRVMREADESGLEVVPTASSHILLANTPSQSHLIAREAVKYSLVVSRGGGKWI